MNRTSLFAVGAVVSLTIAMGSVLTLVGQPNPAQAANVKMSFKEDVLPIFKGRCIACHQPEGEGYEHSGLDLTTYEGLMKGTKFGPMIIPGNPELSSLMRMLDWKVAPQIRMPHGKKKLSICDRDAIREWIRQGAKNN